MRLTNKLCAQHIGWHFKKHWQVQGRRVPKETGAAAELAKFGIHVKDPENVLTPQKELKFVDVVGSALSPLYGDKSQSNLPTKACHLIMDNNVLLGGLPQAQVLTNTIEIKNFPRQIEDALLNEQFPKAIDRNIQNAIFSSHLLDAQQVKLPRVKLIERPAFNLPRLYGISHERRNRLLVNKLLVEIEKLAGRSVSERRKVIDNVTFKTSITRDNDLLSFVMGGETLISSCRALEAVKGKYNGELPDLYPMKCTVSMSKQHIHPENNFFPIGREISCSHPHTIVTFFNKTIVNNVHGSDVSTSQFHGRTLLKAFVAAVSKAKQLYGVSVNGDIQKPVVVQCVQTDGRLFHFGVFQLNTLNHNSNSPIKNYWFNRESVELFTECCYKAGRPHIDGYSNEPFRILNAFYHNT